MSEFFLLNLAIFFPLFGSVLLFTLGEKFKRAIGFVALVFPIVSTIAILMARSQAGWDAVEVFRYDWIPSLGIHFSLLFDGLSTFFALVVSGMGILIALYASQYLDDQIGYQNRFYSYLLLFMTSMLGAVLANNIMLTFIFWEFTGIASFFLIGFFHDKYESQRGARMALLVTVFTGLFLLLGVVFIGLIFQSYELDQIFNDLTIAPYHHMLPLALVCVLIGAFGKSAQFPFQFWLPNAMAAPTPVSAYLHSATMVKLGIFLTARLYPIFASHPLWSEMLVVFGITTMCVGSFLALLSNDLKGILAYSTVSQLGFLMAFYGFSHPTGVEHDFFHIANHVFYKGALFMVAGIVDHSVGTRDIRKLGGLFKSMPLTGIAAIICCLSMAGIPGTTGFISKELFLELLVNFSPKAEVRYLLIAAMLFSAICMVAFSFRLILRTFFSKSKEHLHIHKPNTLIQLPPLLLAIAAISFGLAPNLLGHGLELLHSPKLHAEHFSHLAIWHGVNTPLIISLTAITGGLILFFIGQKLDWSFTSIPNVLRFDLGFDRFYSRLLIECKNLTNALRGHKPFEYLPIIIFAFCFFLGTTLAYQIYRQPVLKIPFRDVSILAYLACSIVVLGAFGTVLATSWINKLFSISITGFVITFYFVMYQAPDLALTQILIETVSLILILLFMTRLPVEKDFRHRDLKLKRYRKLLNLSLSIAGGIISFFSIIWVTSRPHPAPIQTYFIENTIPLAQGKNAVNTILVDFRGYDTMGEISVLVIAMLGVLGLLMRRTRTLREEMQGSQGPAGSGDYEKLAKG